MALTAMTEADKSFSFSRKMHRNYIASEFSSFCYLRIRLEALCAVENAVGVFLQMG